MSELTEAHRQQLVGPDARMDGYFISFTRTGNDIVDQILSAVAIAAKGAQSTEYWCDELDCPYGPVPAGKSFEWLVQQAANDAAERLKVAEPQAMTVMSGSEFWAADPAPGTVFFDLGASGHETVGFEIDPEIDDPSNAVMYGTLRSSYEDDAIAVLKWGSWDTSRNQKIRALRDQAQELMAEDERRSRPARSKQHSPREPAQGRVHRGHDQQLRQPRCADRIGPGPQHRPVR